MRLTLSLILGMHDGILQYRVKRVGYEDDPEWYNAENFEWAPYRL
jgi:hypothetical protein